MFGHFLSFNIPPTCIFVKLIKINIAQNKKAGLERSQGATCGLPAQVRQKHLHCTEKAYNAGKSPVLKVFKGGLRLLPAACVALKAGPALLRKRKILIISLQSQPAPAG